MKTRALARRAVLPADWRLWATWALLMGLTSLSLVAGDAGSAGAVRPLGLGAVVLVLAAGFFKAQQILWQYLELGRSTAAWKVTFVAFLTTISLVILAAYALAMHGSLHFG